MASRHALRMREQNLVALDGMSFPSRQKQKRPSGGSPRKALVDDEFRRF